MKKYLLSIGTVAILMSVCVSNAEEYVCKGEHGGGYSISPNDNAQSYCTRKYAQIKGPRYNGAEKYYNEIYRYCVQEEFPEAKNAYRPGNCEKINVTQTQKNGVKCIKKVWSSGQSIECEDGSGYSNVNTSIGF